MTLRRVEIEWDGQLRFFLLDIPPDAKSGRIPLIVFLHGTGGTAEWALEEVGWLTLARRERFALAVPEALPPDPSRKPMFLANPPRWNDGSPSPGKLPPSTANDVGFISQVIDRVQSEIGPEGPVFLTGFSNGAGMTFHYASRCSERLTAVAPVAGLWARQDLMPARALPTLFIIGDQDPLIPLAGGEVQLPWSRERQNRPPVEETLQAWAKAVGCNTLSEVVSETAEFIEKRYPPISPTTVEYRAIIVHKLGHHWPGGQGRLNPRIGGQPNDRLNGCERLWRFFQSYCG